ncbi:DsbA family oxidoreductase [Lutibacter citreus]|uniref:DsbA family oxidoreductase n=1 Tax=Lutibacter citreus TaxID=2138210 RepID=UPI000DBE2BBD|nr:DsbA family oxidoreductase [Lutibacter citreus]
MSDKIRIDVISDVVCPWCIIGYKRLEKAIDEMGIQDKIELEWQPFELNPDMPAEGENIIEHISRKYGSSLEDQEKSQAYMTEMGAELGFQFNYNNEMNVVNTLDAHILLDYAKEQGKQTALNLSLVKAFFTDGKDISKKEILTEALKRVDLNVEEAMLRLDDLETRERVKNKERFWTSRGVSSVPTVVFNSTSALNGAQPVNVYKQVLTELLNKKQIL